MSVDMGGTSYDVCLVRAGAPDVKAGWNWHHRYLIGLPMVDVQSVGAGGGSIARVESGVLRVGPESAGAQPGPVCYGRGGVEPTVTDANLVLGYLNPAAFCGGTMRLDVEGAHAAIRERVARPLGMSVVEAAEDWGWSPGALAGWRRLWSARRVDLASRYGRIDAPLLVISGDDDFFHHDAQRLAREWGAPSHFASGPWGHGLVGGVTIILGQNRFIGGGLIFLFMVLTATLVHHFWTEKDPMARINETIHFWKDIALGGAALLIAFYAGWSWPLSLGG